jgi:hypothetical protein
MGVDRQRKIRSDCRQDRKHTETNAELTPCVLHLLPNDKDMPHWPVNMSRQHHLGRTFGRVLTAAAA